jgi:hypothetical protein
MLHSQLIEASNNPIWPKRNKYFALQTPRPSVSVLPVVSDA